MKEHIFFFADYYYIIIISTRMKNLQNFKLIDIFTHLLKA